MEKKNPRTMEYVMSRTMAETILNNKRHGEKEKKMTPQEYLVYIVNQQFGVKNPVVRVILD